MSATASGRIQKHETFVQLDLSDCGLPEVLASCTAFAALCMTSPIRCALLKGGDEDRQRCLAVRDLLKTMLLVVPRDLRLALVPGALRTGAVYRRSEVELRAMGLDARCFENETLAAQWFGVSAVSGRGPSATRASASGR